MAAPSPNVRELHTLIANHINSATSNAHGLHTQATTVCTPSARLPPVLPAPPGAKVSANHNSSTPRNTEQPAAHTLHLVQVLAVLLGAPPGRAQFTTAHTSPASSAHTKSAQPSPAQPPRAARPSSPAQPSPAQPSPPTQQPRPSPAQPCC